MHAIGLSGLAARRVVSQIRFRSPHIEALLQSRSLARHSARRQVFGYSTTVTAGEVPVIKPPRSYFRRIAIFLAIATLSASAGFAMTVGPIIPTVNKILSPPSDAETRTMFQPPTEKIAQEEDFVQNHPLVLQLRSNPDFVESRPHIKIPDNVREHHLTAGVLAGPGKLEIPPLQFVEKDGKEGVTVFYIGTDLCGHQGFVHGGAMATLLDEALARSCFQALPNKIGMTANLNINYRKPLPAGSFAVIRSVTTKVEGRKVWVEGTLESLPLNGEEKQIYCEANALFIEPKQAAALAKLFSNAAT